MPRRPFVDLKSLTADQAAPMPEATQRNASLSLPLEVSKLARKTKTENLQALAFKVPPEFRRLPPLSGNHGVGFDREWYLCHRVSCPKSRP